MGDLGGAVVEDDQAPGGERFQDLIDLGPVSIRVRGVQVGPVHRAAGEPAVAAGHGHGPQDVPGELLLRRRESVVDGVGAGLDGEADSARQCRNRGSSAGRPPGFPR